MIRLFSLILSACGFAVAGNQTTTAPAQRFSVRLIPEKVTPDVEHEVLLAPNDHRERIPVSNVAILETSDVEQVELTHMHGETVGVMLTLTEDAGRRMQEFTRANIEKEIAIVLDGTVVSAPRIATEVGRHVAVYVGTSKEAVRRSHELHRALSRRPPPATQP